MPLSETHPDYEVRLRPVLGIFKTYAKIELLEVKSIIQAGASSAGISEFDLNVMWALFGHQTMLSLLKADLR